MKNSNTFNSKLAKLKISSVYSIVTTVLLTLVPETTLAEENSRHGSTHDSTVQVWWAQCNGDLATSTCLTDTELSKFKTICANKIYREECRLVVNYVLAKTRISEGKYFLNKGFESEASNYSINKSYITEIEKIWDLEKVNTAHSFAVGILPSCQPSGKKNLFFSTHLRPKVKELKAEFLKVYESLITIPCPDLKNGVVLVTIGKVNDSSSEFEVFTKDETQNIKILRTAVGPNPFAGN